MLRPDSDFGARADSKDCLAGEGRVVVEVGKDHLDQVAPSPKMAVTRWSMITAKLREEVSAADSDWLLFLPLLHGSRLLLGAFVVRLAKTPVVPPAG